MAKNLVVFSDGTGQEGGKGHNTNIYKLFNMIEDRTPNQMAFYDQGLGTDWRRWLGMITGLGISRNIMDCYEFLFKNFQAGDNIYLFGFSRGAATVRSLSAFIHMFGILPRSRANLIKEAYGIYRINNDEKRQRKAREFIAKHHTMWCRIKFIGCWDTVAALGVPIQTISVILDKIPFFKHRFHNFRLSPSVEHAYHALAIDDERRTFHPVLWEPELLEYQTMQQVWFCGAHTDVGGGYKEPQLSDIPLVWMTRMAVQHGLRLYPKHQVTVGEDIDGVMHDSRKGFPGFLYRKKVRSWDRTKYGKPVVHESVRQRTKNKQNYDTPPYAPWILQQDCDTEPWVKELPTG